MQQPIRDIVIDLMFEGTREAQDQLHKIFDEDPYAKVIYDQEKTNVLIEKYLDGSLSENESKEFQVLLEVDPQVKREIKLRSDVNKLTHSLPLISALDEAYDSYLEEETNEFLSIRKYLDKQKHYPVVKFSIAATIVLLLTISGLFYFNSEKGPVEQEIFAQYYNPISSELVAGFSMQSNQLEKGFSNYFEKDYKSAIIILEQTPGTIDIKAERDFFCGLSYLALNNTTKAIERFEKIINREEYFEFTPQTYWYLGLSYLKVGKTQEAVTIFENIVHNQGEYYKEAKKILKKIG